MLFPFICFLQTRPSSGLNLQKYLSKQQTIIFAKSTSKPDNGREHGIGIAKPPVPFFCPVFASHHFAKKAVPNQWPQTTTLPGRRRTSAMSFHLPVKPVFLARSLLALRLAIFYFPFPMTYFPPYVSFLFSTLSTLDADSAGIFSRQLRRQNKNDREDDVGRGPRWRDQMPAAQRGLFLQMSNSVGLVLNWLHHPGPCGPGQQHPGGRLLVLSFTSFRVGVPLPYFVAGSPLSTSQPVNHTTIFPS